MEEGTGPEVCWAAVFLGTGPVALAVEEGVMAGDAAD